MANNKRGQPNVNMPTEENVTNEIARLDLTNDVNKQNSTTSNIINNQPVRIEPSTSGTSRNNGSQSLTDMPMIRGTINNVECTITLDSGSNTTVCSEAFFNKLLTKGIKLCALPTCGTFCLTAVGKSKQRIKFQCLLPITICGHKFEIMTMVIPGLVTDLIAGTDTLLAWEACMSFGARTLLIRKPVQIEMPLMTKKKPQPHDDDDDDDDSDLIYVEHLNIQKEATVSGIRVVRK